MNGQGQCRTGVRTGEMTSAPSAPVILSVTGDSAQRACIAESTSLDTLKKNEKNEKRKKMHVSREDYFPYSSVLFVFFRGAGCWQHPFFRFFEEHDEEGGVPSMH